MEPSRAAAPSHRAPVLGSLLEKAGGRSGPDGSHTWQAATRGRQTHLGEGRKRRKFVGKQTGYRRRPDLVWSRKESQERKKSGRGEQE